MKQIIKGWVTEGKDFSSDEGEIYLIKHDLNKVTDDDDGRQLKTLVANALQKLGAHDLCSEDDYENGIASRYIIENISLELFASEKRLSIDKIREHIILDSMGLLEFQENWYGYSTWTIEGFHTETFTLGGHDILEILGHYKDKFIYLVIDKVG